MPNFDFECKHCGKKYEQRVPKYDSDPKCPQCGSIEAIKLISPFSFQFKGGYTAANGYSKK